LLGEHRRHEADRLRIVAVRDQQQRDQRHERHLEPPERLRVECGAEARDARVAVSYHGGFLGSSRIGVPITLRRRPASVNSRMPRRLSNSLAGS